MQKYKTQLHLPRLRKKKGKKKHVLSRSNVSERVLRRWIESKHAVVYTFWLRKAPVFFFFCCTTPFVSALIKHEGTYGAQFVLTLIGEGDKRNARRTTTTTTTSFYVAKTRRPLLSGYLEVSRCLETPRGQQAFNGSAQTFKLLINFTALRVEPLQS